MDTLGERLRHERKRLGMTQSELANLAGIERRAQSNYENNQRNPDTAYMGKLARAGFDVLFIMTGVNMNAPVTETLTPDEVDLLDGYRGLKKSHKAHLKGVLNALSLGDLGDVAEREDEDENEV